MPLTPDQLGFLMSKYATTIAAKRDLAEVKTFLPDFSAEEQERVAIELIFMQAFVTDYVLWKVFQERPERNQTMEAFFSFLDKTAKTDKESRAINKMMQSRLRRYGTVVVATDNTQRFIDGVGLVFAHACGHPNDEKLAMLGKINFSAKHKATLDLVKAETTPIA